MHPDRVRDHRLGMRGQHAGVVDVPEEEGDNRPPELVLPVTCPSVMVPVEVVKVMVF